MPKKLEGDVIINCNKTSRKEMKELLALLPTAPINSLTLQDFDHFKSKRSLYIMFSMPNYLTKILAALKNNHHIQKLVLDKSFSQLYSAYSDGADSNHQYSSQLYYSSFPIPDLLDMQDLKTLVLEKQSGI